MKNRIVVVDVLRGFAIMGIFMLHCIEHFNFYSFPQAPNEFISFTDKAIWDSMFFMFGGKAYAIFALLFGFSFFIQDSHSKARGFDFRSRFAWRLFLLFIIGNINAMFFTAEVLVLYSIVGFALLPMCRLNNKTVLIIAAICMLQPVEIGKIVYALVNPDYIPSPSLDAPYWSVTSSAQANADFWGMLKVNLWEGQLASLGWAWENGRFLQTASLFMLGMVMGRTDYLDGSEKHMKFNINFLILSLVLFFPLFGLSTMLPSFIENRAILVPARLIVSSLHKFAFMTLLVTSIVWLYYNSAKMSSLLYKLVPYGRMSLTNYITQSIIGSFLFYGWGLGLYKYCGITYSFLIGIVLFIIQYQLSVWWLKRHTHGPLEFIWKKATWINSKN